MTQELLNKKLKEIPNYKLIENCQNIVRELCKTGGRSFTMSVPVRETDTDMMLTELIERFKELSNKTVKLEK